MRSVGTFVGLLLFSASGALGQYAHQGSLHLDAQINPSAPSITLTISRFSTTGTDTQLEISRKGLTNTAWTVLYSSTPVSAYTDTTVVAGVVYEYQARMSNSNYLYDDAFGYVATGIHVPPQHSRGRLVLIVDETLAPALATDLEAYRQALVGDGWTVSRLDAPRHVAYPNTNAAPVLRNRIKALYNSDPSNFKGVVIIGKVQVPYSGDTAPDGHAEHTGAWPADAYYGEMNEDASWTDASVNNTNATFDGGRNRNIPGDGKFDPTTVQNVELFVGRIDASNLGAHATNGLSEANLIRRYIRKNIWYRSNQMQTARRAFVSDAFLTYTEYYSGWTGYKGIPPLYKRADVTIGASPYATVREALLNGDYEWSYVASAGDAGGMGPNSLDSAVPVYRTVKNQFYAPFGSYFGDWDHSNNGFLKSLIASERYGLAAIWGNRSASVFSRMAMNQSLGDSLQRTTWDRARNYPSPRLYDVTYFPSDVGRLQIAILGDPTLRLYRVGPPRDVAVDRSGPSHEISWQPSAESVAGYHVYRAPSLEEAFTRLNATILTGASYAATGGGTGDVYMVRAEAAITATQGSFSELSQGAFAAEVRTNTTPYVEADEVAFTESVSIPLTARAFDDSAVPLTVQWEKVSGPGTVAFDPAGSLAPTATFSQAGYYEVRVTVSDGLLSSSNTIGVRALGNRFVTTADTYVRADNPSATYNNYNSTLALQDGTNRTAYLKFQLGDPGAYRIKQATLRVRTYTASVSGGSIQAYAVTNTTWNPDTLNATNAPPIGAEIGSVAVTNGMTGQWVDLDLTDHLRYATGSLSVALRSTTQNYLSSDGHDAGSKASHLLVQYEPSPGVLSFQQSSYSIWQTAGMVLNIPVSRLSGLEGAVSVGYAVTGGTAQAGVHYSATTGTLAWANGESTNKVIGIPILVAPGATLPASFNVSLINFNGASPGAITTTTVHISNPDIGLVLHYRFEEGAGTTVGDSSTEGNDHTTLAITGATWTASGKFGGAYGSEAATVVVGFNPANQADLNFNPASNAHTISTWVMSTSPANYCNIFHKDTERRLWTATTAGDGISKQLQAFAGGSSTTYNTAPDGITINDGQWHLLTYVHYLSGSTWKTRVYLDAGTKFKEFNSGTTTSVNPLAIGKNATGASNQWRGFLDDLRIYNRPLTQAEVAALYQGAYGGWPATGTDTGTAYSSWTAGIDWQGAASGPYDDPDGDRLPNLLEYAFGGRALVADPGLGLSATWTAQNLFAAVFPRIADPALRYEVWGTDDLFDWGAEPMWFSSGAENIVGLVTVTNAMPAASRRFLHLRVILTNP
jgi:hypothetical protein